MSVIYRGAATQSTGAPEPIISRDVLVSSEALLALNATPISLVPAQGTAYALIFEGAQIHKPAGVAYGGIAAGEDLSIRYTDGAGTELGNCETVGFLDQATAQSRYMRAWCAASGVSQITPTANAALVLNLLTGEIVTGDSALHVRIFYRIVPIGAFAS